MEANHMQEPHVYLSFLCAHPSHRGQGIGHALMEPMLKRCDRDNLPIYLENTKPQNEAFYRKYGFEVLHQIPLCKDNAPYYAAMKRNPREARP
jgi:ribosomal protein S18 acetylase RimI-like enzyme